MLRFGAGARTGKARMAMDRHGRPQGRFALTLIGTFLVVAGTGMGAIQDGPGLGPLVLP